MKCWNELVVVKKKKINANISKAAWCGHKWGVMMGKRGRERREEILGKGARSHTLKWSGLPSYWFHGPKASPATGIYPFLPKNYSQCLLLQSWKDHSWAWKPCGLQTFLPQGPFFNQNLRWQTNTVNTALSLSNWDLGMAQSEAPWSAAWCLPSKGTEAQSSGLPCPMAQQQSVTCIKLLHSLKTIFFLKIN